MSEKNSPEKRSPSEREEVKPVKKLKEEENEEDYQPESNNSSDDSPPILSDEESHGDMEDFDLEAYLKFREQETESDQSSPN